MKNNVEKNGMNKNIKRIAGAWKLLATALIVTILAIGGCKNDNSDNNNNNNNGNLNATDKDFMAKVSEANKAEIDAGSTAAVKGNTDSVRNFGQFMVTEHTTAKTSLDSLASALYVTLADTLS